MALHYRVDSHPATKFRPPFALKLRRPRAIAFIVLSVEYPSWKDETTRSPVAYPARLHLRAAALRFVHPSGRATALR